MKQFESGRKLNEKIMNGVNKLADAVGTTLGPRGRNVILKGTNTKPIITKDGVTVARAINLKDRFANLGVQIVREAAQRTAEEAGDGGQEGGEEVMPTRDARKRHESRLDRHPER